MKEYFRKRIPQSVWNYYRTLKRWPAFLRARRKMRGENFPPLKFYDDQTAVDRIIRQGASLSRFGDGEIKWMLGESHHSFQTYSNSLARDLVRAYQSGSEKLLIGIPYALIDARPYKFGSRMFWETLKSDRYRQLLALTDSKRTFCDTNITRPYIDYRKGYPKIDNFERFKRVWNQRELIIVEGQETRMGVGNDLLDTAASVHRILCPSTNAYAKIEEIKECIRKHAASGQLILCALGPTASILAADLSAEGYQVLDIGHLDVEYMWYLRRARHKTPIDGKYVNEVADKSRAQRFTEDAAYAASVIDRVI